MSATRHYLKPGHFAQMKLIHRVTDGEITHAGLNIFTDDRGGFVLAFPTGLVTYGEQPSGAFYGFKTCFRSVWVYIGFGFLWKWVPKYIKGELCGLNKRIFRPRRFVCGSYEVDIDLSPENARLYERFESLRDRRERLVIQ